MPKSLNQVLGEVLTAEMKRRQLSANALGARAGLAPNTIGNYMRGSQEVGVKGKERSAKLAEVERLAQALGVSPLLLLTDPVESEISHIDADQTVDADVQRIATVYANLSPTERRRFLHLLAAARDDAPVLGDDWEQAWTSRTEQMIDETRARPGRERVIDEMAPRPPSKKRRLG